MVGYNAPYSASSGHVVTPGSSAANRHVGQGGCQTPCSFGAVGHTREQRSVRTAGVPLAVDVAEYGAFRGAVLDAEPVTLEWPLLPPPQPPRINAIPQTPALTEPRNHKLLTAHAAFHPLGRSKHSVMRV